jgi:hypothetical protein
VTASFTPGTTPPTHVEVDPQEPPELELVIDAASEDEIKIKRSAIAMIIFNIEQVLTIKPLIMPPDVLVWLLKRSDYPKPEFEYNFGLRNYERILVSF